MTTRIENAVPEQLRLHNAHKAAMARMTAADPRDFLRTELAAATAKINSLTAKIDSDKARYAFDMELLRVGLSDAKSAAAKARAELSELKASFGMERAERAPTSIREIQIAVAKYFREKYNSGVPSIDDLISASRQERMALPRQIAMFLCREMTPRSLAEVGHLFGDRDHTTVLHAVQKIGNLSLVVDSELSKDIRILRDSLVDSAVERAASPSPQIVGAEAR